VIARLCAGVAVAALALAAGCGGDEPSDAVQGQRLAAARAEALRQQARDERTARQTAERPRPVRSRDCGSYLAQGPTGPFRATEITAAGVPCDEARDLIDSGPTGRASSGWTCPVTGYRYYTSCTRGKRRVAWSIPRGDTPAVATQVDCGSYGRATSIRATNVDCSVAQTVVAAGAAQRAAEGWTCPVTGDDFNTACTRGPQRISWAIPGGDDPEEGAGGRCGSFDVDDPGGGTMTVTDVEATGVSCDAARSMISAGPAGRASAGWDCPVTGDETFTRCTRGTESVEWTIPAVDDG
jgi:hypothetical protein